MSGGLAGEGGKSGRVRRPKDSYVTAGRAPVGQKIEAKTRKARKSARVAEGGLDQKANRGQCWDSRETTDYGTVLADRDPVDSTKLHVFIDADKTRLLELTPFALHALLSRQRDSFAGATLASNADVWAFPAKTKPKKDRQNQDVLSRSLRNAAPDSVLKAVRRSSSETLRRPEKAEVSPPNPQNQHTNNKTAWTSGEIVACVLAHAALFASLGTLVGMFWWMFGGDTAATYI